MCFLVLRLIWLIIEQNDYKRPCSLSAFTSTRSPGSIPTEGKYSPLLWDIYNNWKFGYWARMKLILLAVVLSVCMLMSSAYPSQTQQRRRQDVCKLKNLMPARCSQGYSDKNLGWKRDKWVGILSMPSSLGCIFRRISLIPPDCFGNFWSKINASGLIWWFIVILWCLI